VTFEAFGFTMKNRGRYWENEVTPLMGADGKPRQLRVVSRDITDRRQPEQS
jgi:PAS domain-containing protein